SRHADLPPPLRRAEVERADHVVRNVGNHHAEYDVELEGSHKPSAPLGRSQLRDVHRTEHRRRTDAEPSDEAEKYKGVPIPCEVASTGRAQKKRCRNAQRLAAA